MTIEFNLEQAASHCDERSTSFQEAQTFNFEF